jgi:DNA-binding Lrp family transcriptional regulator
MVVSVTELDAKDRKLLYELDFHARVPNTQLAHKLGLSKQSVQYRINRLVKKGIIQGFYPVVNMPALGYIYCRLSMVLKDITETEYEHVLEELKNDKRLFWIFTTQGNFDILTVTWAKTITEFRNTTEDILAKYGRFIEDFEQHIITDVVHYQHRYLLNKSQTEELHLEETTERKRIDKTDEAIIKELCEDARASIVEISNKTGLSARQTLYRIRRMEKEKLILGYRPVIDHNKLGYTYFKLWINLHNFTTKDMRSIKEFMRQRPDVLYYVEGVALPELLDIEIMVKSNQELHQFVQELRNKYPKIIGSFKSFMFIKTVKVKYYPF